MKITLLQEILNDPTEEYTKKVREWADKNLEEGNITKSMHTFVTDIEDSHASNPKPLYKTHKTDENGEMINPVPIRNVQTACGTPVANLSKVMQCNISHLTTKQKSSLEKFMYQKLVGTIVAMPGSSH